MKIEYDKELYIKIAMLNINEVIVTTNRKGQRKTIHITKITNLTWQELQLLVNEGADKFTKMFLLYEKYTCKNVDSRESASKFFKGDKLSPSEASEIAAYVRIFQENNFKEHFQVNEYITNNDKWDEFSTIRSLNDHKEYKRIPGILPKYFEIICNLLNIGGASGRSLDSATHY